MKQLGCKASGPVSSLSQDCRDAVRTQNSRAQKGKACAARYGLCHQKSMPSSKHLQDTVPSAPQLPKIPKVAQPHRDKDDMMPSQPIKAKSGDTRGMQALQRKAGKLQASQNAGGAMVKTSGPLPPARAIAPLMACSFC